MQRHEVRAQPRLVHRPVVDAVGLGREPVALQPLDAEALHDPDAGDALLDDARQLRELLLQREADREHALAEAGRRDVEQRQRGRARRTRGPGCATTRMTATATIWIVLAIVSGISSTTLLICWMSVFA